MFNRGVVFHPHPTRFFFFYPERERECIPLVSHALSPIHYRARCFMMNKYAGLIRRDPSGTKISRSEKHTLAHTRTFIYSRLKFQRNSREPAIKCCYADGRRIQIFILAFFPPPPSSSFFFFSFSISLFILSFSPPSSPLLLKFP